MLRQYLDSFATRYQPYKGGDWCYEDGCIYRGLTLMHAADPGGPWVGHVERLVAPQVDKDGRLKGYRLEEYNIDHIMPGRTLLFLHARTGDPRFMRAADRLAAQLKTHPRIAAGNYWHKQMYPEQVWLDGLYMGLPFQIDYGMTTGNAGLVNDAVSQVMHALELLRDRASGLYRHGYDATRRQQWADPRTGQSPSHWSRGIGWLSMAMVDIAELLGTAHASAAGLADAAEDLAKAMARHRTGDGRWLQLTDRPEIAGNYAESSATAMLAYFYLKGARLGIGGLDAAIGRRALTGLRDHGLRPGRNGRVELHDICRVAGLGGFEEAYRDGSPEYYLSEARVADDAKGVGPLMMAVAEEIPAGIAATSERSTA